MRGQTDAGAERPLRPRRDRLARRREHEPLAVPQLHVDEHHDLLKWAIMPFSYDPNTVADGVGLPLHPGATRYYRESGYLK